MKYIYIAIVLTLLNGCTATNSSVIPADAQYVAPENADMITSDWEPINKSKPKGV